MTVPTVYVSGSRLVTISGYIAAVIQGTISTSPLVLATDFVDVASGNVPSSIPSGYTAAHYQGENGFGGYFTIYGINLGTAANLGTNSGARVYVNSIEVANYRYLVSTVGVSNGDPRALQALGVQFGSAAIQSGLTTGTAYQLTVIVNGVVANLNDLDGHQLTITPIVAPVIFVDEQNGNDSNNGLIGSPKQHIQTYPGSGSVMTGVTASNSQWNSSTQTGGIIPGTQVVMRQGTGGYIWTYAGTFQARWCNFFRCTGTSPNSNASGGGLGINNGYLKYTSYPGPVNGNAPEIVNYQQPAVTGGGGFNGNDTARAQESTPFGFTGYCQNIAISNVICAINAAATSSDACPVNLQTSAKNWRIHNCDLSWPSTLNSGGGNGPLGAAIAGDAICVAQCNYLHDIHDVSGGLQNHGIYFDANLIYSRNCIAAYNYIKNITGGNGIQIFTNKLSGTDPDGFTGATGMSIHHNLIDTTGKYGLNANISCKTANWYCNIVLNVTRYNVCVGIDASTPVQIAFSNNTLYNTQGQGLNTLVENDYQATNGVVDFRNNCVVMGASRSDNTLAFYANNANDSAWVRTSNVWYDPQGHTTSAPSGGTGELYGNPNFVTPYTNFQIQAPSPCIGAATTSPYINPTYDFFLNPMTRSGQSVNSIGASA